MCIRGGRGISFWIFSPAKTLSSTRAILPADLHPYQHLRHSRQGNHWEVSQLCLLCVSGSCRDLESQTLAGWWWLTPRFSNHLGDPQPYSLLLGCSGGQREIPAVSLPPSHLLHLLLGCCEESWQWFSTSLWVCITSQLTGDHTWGR